MKLKTPKEHFTQRSTRSVKSGGLNDYQGCVVTAQMLAYEGPLQAR